MILRTGLVGDVESSPEDKSTVDKTIALLRLFSEDAIGIAGRYTCAHQRNEVTAMDMKCALMYCARTFFEQAHVDLDARMREEMRIMEDESDEETASEDEEDEDNSEEDEEVDDEDGEEENEDPMTDAALVSHVNAIVASWPLWDPVDPVHVLIKRAIDQTLTE